MAWMVRALVVLSMGLVPGCVWPGADCTGEIVSLEDGAGAGCAVGVRQLDVERGCLLEPQLLLARPGLTEDLGCVRRVSDGAYFQTTNPVPEPPVGWVDCAMSEPMNVFVLSCED